MSASTRRKPRQASLKGEVIVPGYPLGQLVQAVQAQYCPYGGGVEEGELGLVISLSPASACADGKDHAFVELMGGGMWFHDDFKMRPVQPSALSERLDRALERMRTCLDRADRARTTGYREACDASGALRAAVDELVLATAVFPGLAKLCPESWIPIETKEAA